MLEMPCDKHSLSDNIYCSQRLNDIHGVSGLGDQTENMN